MIRAGYWDAMRIPSESYPKPPSMEDVKEREDAIREAFERVWYGIGVAPTVDALGLLVLRCYAYARRMGIDLGEVLEELTGAEVEGRAPDVRAQLAALARAAGALEEEVSALD